MSTFTLPMHANGRVVTLGAILSALDTSGLEWRVVALEAVAKPDSGLDVLELERAGGLSPGGLALSDSGLHTLAGQLEQIIDCEINGFTYGVSPTSRPELSIVAVDSTEWTLSANASAEYRLRADSVLFN